MWNVENSNFAQKSKFWLIIETLQKKIDFLAKEGILA